MRKKPASARSEWRALGALAAPTLVSFVLLALRFKSRACKTCAGARALPAEHPGQSLVQEAGLYSALLQKGWPAENAADIGHNSKGAYAVLNINGINVTVQGSNPGFEITRLTSDSPDDAIGHVQLNVPTELKGPSPDFNTVNNYFLKNSTSKLTVTST